MCSFLLCVAGFCLTHKPNLSLPLGEMSRSDREGWNQLAWLFRFALTRAFLSCAQIKTEHLSILYLLMGVVDSLFCGKATPVATCIQHVAKSRLSNPLLLFSILRVKQKRVQICTLFFGGRWWIRTTEVVDNRFTVCPLWPLGKPPIFTCRNRGAGGRT